jgi:hypothetical protein
MRFSTGIVAAVLAAIVGATPAGAQTASRIGPSMTAIAGAVRGTNSAYDFKNGRYLVVSAYGGLNGVFVTADGVVGAPFVLPTGDFAHYPGVAYSPDLFGGAGGFLVTWHQSLGTGAIVHARLVTAAGVLAPEIQVSAGGSWWEAAADVAYSTGSKEFLVVWQGVGITGQRIDLNGQPIGGNFQVTPAAYRRDPAVVYNPTTNQFMVGFGGEDGISPFAGFQRVAAGSGALVGPEGIVGRARGVYIAEVAYNSATNQYLVAWYQGGTYAVLVDANGNVLTNATLLSTTVTAYDALGIDYNASSGTFMMVSHRSDSQQDGGVEISGTGLVPDVPIIATDSVPATAGNFYPKVSSRVGKPEWLLTTATGFGATTVQRLGTTATGGGGGGGGPTLSTPCSTSSLSVTSTVGLGSPASAISVAVTVPGSCSWTAASNDSWMQVTNTSGNGPGSVTVNVLRNTSTTARRGTLAIAGQSIVVQQAGYNAAATHDMTGDGYSDFLWQYQPTGELALWTVRGINVVSRQSLISVVDLSWKVVGTGDLDGNGRADIVWQKTDGTVAAWLWTPQGYLAGAGLLTPSDVGTHWKVRGVGDLNGDGKADIVWQHDTGGWLAVWLMNGLTAVSTVFLSLPQQTDLNWLIVGAGDINGDGMADILWQNQATGRLGAWLMNGPQVLSTATLAASNPDLNWKVVGVGDVEGNGFADLIWENMATGSVGVWTLSGFSVQYVRPIYDQGAPAVVDLNWRMVGPG